MPSTNHSSGKYPRVTKIRTSRRKRAHRQISDQQFSTVSSSVISSSAPQVQLLAIEQSHVCESEFPLDISSHAQSAGSSIKSSTYAKPDTVDEFLHMPKISSSRSDTTFNAHQCNSNSTRMDDLKKDPTYERVTSTMSMGDISKKQEHNMNHKRRRMRLGYCSPCSPCCCYLSTIAGVSLAIAAAVIAVALSTAAQTTTSTVSGTAQSSITATSSTQTTTTTSTVTTSTISTTTSSVTTATTTTTVTTTSTSITTTTTSMTTTTSRTTTTTKAPIYNVNMLVNGDAETGPCATDGNVTSPTGWTTNGDITQLEYNNTHIYNRVNGVPIPTNRGDCFFYGSNDLNTTMWQTVDLAGYTDSSLIDSSVVRFNLSAWLGGYIHHNDKPSVWLSFLDQNNQTVGSTSKVGPLTSNQRNDTTMFLFRQTTGLVPVGARSMTVSVMIDRDIGGINDGYVDNICVFLYV